VNRRSLGFRIAVAFAVVAFATAAIAAFVLTVTWQRRFEAYVQRGVQEQADAAAEVVARSYQLAGGWDRVDLMELAHFGMLYDLRLQVLDADGDVVAYTTDQAGEMKTGGTAPSGEEIRAQAPVVVNGIRVGSVLVKQDSAADLLTDRDRWFRRVSLAGLALAALIAVGLASLAGALYARSIVKPIEDVTQVADQLRRGRRDARTGMHGGDPITDLGATLDQMADAIDADRRFEQQLTADVAHELRTPLQAIQATVEAMQDGVLPVDEERLGLLHDETVRLGRLAGSILELSRLETGSAPFTMAPIDAAAPVRVAVESSRALMESTGHVVEEMIAEGLVVTGDGDRLTQAVGNLLSNAARYTPEGGRVRVRVLRDGPHAVIEVADSGMGVDEADRERVFTRFWRADPARTRASGGLGIGLAVVKEIVDRHDGAVGIGSSDLGGTSVWIRLPLSGQRA